MSVENETRNIQVKVSKDEQFKINVLLLNVDGSTKSTTTVLETYTAQGSNCNIQINMNDSGLSNELENITMALRDGTDKILEYIEERLKIQNSILALFLLAGSQLWELYCKLGTAPGIGPIHYNILFLLLLEGVLIITYLLVWKAEMVLADKQDILDTEKVMRNPKAKKKITQQIQSDIYNFIKELETTEKAVEPLKNTTPSVVDDLVLLEKLEAEKKALEENT